MVIVFISCGPAGSGKTSVSTALSQTFQCPFIEGDALHPKENVDKMNSGIPLNDEDRWPWLRSLKEKFLQESQMVKTGTGNKLVFVTCSALKRSYRNFLQEIDNTDIKVIFVYLRVSRDFLLQRLLSRKGHFMSASMLDSQLATLEEPELNEESVWIIDANQPFENLISNLTKKIIKEMSIQTN